MAVAPDPATGAARRSLAEVLARIDAALEAPFEPLRGNAVANRVFYTASALGDFGLMWVVFALMRALRGGRRNEKAAARAIVATGVESVLVNVALKSFFRRHRPPNEIDHPLPLRVPLTSSFPSGHATAAFCGATLLSEDDPLAPLYFATAAVIAASRVHVKMHHPSDALGGAVIGTVLGLIGRALAPLERGRSAPHPRASSAGRPPRAADHARRRAAGGREGNSR